MIPFDTETTFTSLSNSLSKFNASFKQTVDAMNKVAESLRGVSWVLPQPGSYVRITNEHDSHFGQMAEVIDMGAEEETIWIMLNPFGGGVKLRRPIGVSNVRLMADMEVVAEAAR